MARRVKKAVKRTSVKKPSGKSRIEYAHAISHGSVNLMEQSGQGSGTPEENKSQRLELRLTKRQKDFISKASSVSGFKNVSDYILHLAISDSKNVIREQQIFELSERDRVSFMETLENPPEPGKNLKKAMASYLSFQDGK
jgi:uncharacterized protein (DUF1778 family)